MRIGVRRGVDLQSVSRAVCLLGFVCGLPLIVAQSAWGQPLLAAAVLPTSRSVQVGKAATVFASIINGGTSAGLGCRIAPRTVVPATFTYQTTNPATNQTTGSPDTPADIQPGALQTFLLSFTPTATFGPTDLQFDFTCTNAAPAGVIPGVNTLLLSASSTPVPDIIAMAATSTGDGIVNLPGPTGSGAFAVATANVGAGGIITTSADTGGVVLPVDLFLCPTNPATGQCLSAATPTVTAPINAGATPTFSIFVTGRGIVPFDPANNRIFVRFRDAGGIIRGQTSVAVRTVQPTADPTFFHALSDSRPLPDAELLAQGLPVLQLLDCPPVAQPNALTLSDALSSIRSRLDQLAGAGALDQFLAGNAPTDASTLAARAGAAMTSNKGPGALAALLAAHQNDPTNPAHLVNAAGAAALLRMPNEALALLDAADAMGGDFRSPMGFDGHAIALNNRGFALLQLGQYQQAQAPLASANSLEPFLAEARMNAAVAQLCQGQDATATFLSAVHRSPGQLTLDQIFDLSPGVAPDIPLLPYPGAAERLRAFATRWGQIHADVLAKVTEAQDQREQARQQLVQEQQSMPWPLLTSKRVGEIYGFGDGLGTPTFDEESPHGLSDLYAVVSQDNTTTFDLYTQINADFGVWTGKRDAAAQTCNAQKIPLQTCQPYLQVLDQGRSQVHIYLGAFLSQVGNYERAFLTFVDPWSRALTGLAANLSDQYAHQVRESQARADVFFQYSGVVNRGWVIQLSLANWWEAAQAPPDLSGTPSPNAPALQSLGACPDQLKGVKFQGSLFDAINITISCEKVSAEISSPGLGPFAQVTVPRSGDWTVFMGVKGSLPGTTARFGVYVRGNDNSFTDAGIKSSQSIGAGPLKIQSPFDMELGVAAAMKCPLGFCN